MKRKLLKKVISALLAIVLLLNPLLGTVALAQEVPTPTPADQSESDSTQTVVVTDNNDAQVTNDVVTEANTGDNEIVTSTPTPNPEDVNLESTTPSPTPIINPLPEDLSVGQSNPENEDLGGQATPTPILEILGDGGSGPESILAGAIVENLEIGDTTPNVEASSSETTVSVTNDNDATVNTSSDTSSDAGNNSVSGEDATIEAGDSTASTDVVNFVNTNLVGADFWQLIINMFASSDNDIDLTKIEGYQSFDPTLLSILASNSETGDGLVNIALANILSSCAVLNNNNAQVTNDITVSANTGNNQIEGEDGTIETGNATANANVFNLVNTNLVGNDWFFGIINLFKQQNGDIILPYELQYLFGYDENGNSLYTTATNQDTGDGSQNQALASSIDSTSITNNNQANINNDINVSSNTGNNTIVGEDGSITTGNAQAMVDLMNIVNTNIYGSHWLLLAVNNYGNWNGDILGWWGNKITIGNTTYIWIKLPDDSLLNSQGNVAAGNSQTGDGSQNQAIASQTTSFEVVNTNNAIVDNNVTVEANTGNNQIDGEDSSIQTGNANASANIANIVNTNIIGNNWFFGVINIFDGFFGNIIFPRPDLEVVKSVNKESANPGEEITYTVFYRNTGRLWAKNVVLDSTLSPGVSFVSASNGGIQQGDKVVWNFNKLESGNSGSFTLVARVDENVPSVTTLTSCVDISSGTDEPNKENNHSCASTFVNRTSSGSTTTPGTDGGSGGTGGSGDGSTGGGTGSSTCTPAEAPKAPKLLSAVSVSPTEVRLTWEKVDRANQYSISYGESSGNYAYGNPNVGDTNTYTVGGLKSEELYYFVVSAVIGGDCSVAGPYSNELSSITPFLSILGAKEAYAAEGSQLTTVISNSVGEVQGAESRKVPATVKKIWPYILLFVLSSFWIVNRSRILSVRYFLKKNGNP